MTAVFRKVQGHLPRDLMRQGKGRRGQEGIIARVQHQSRHLNIDQARLGGSAGPVVVGITVAVQGGGDLVVEFAQGAGPLHDVFAEDAGMASEFGQ